MDSTDSPLLKGPFEVEDSFAGRQFIGCRDHQEDYYAFSDISSDKGPPISRLLVALGDGLGAHIGGQVASSFLIHEFVKTFKSSTLSTAWRLRVSLETANENLFALSSKFSWSDAPMGSTFIGLVVTTQALHWVSVGDSPLFLFRQGVLTRLNDDHSLGPLLDERARRGEITLEESRNHPERHILQSACMGMPLTLVDARMDPFPLESGDIVIASSDGIFTLAHNEIEALINNWQLEPASKIIENLIFSVRCSDSPIQDNITITLVKIP
jgi:serine/threonine protein phosphatase PrpC